jgi:hypothetical protein
LASDQFSVLSRSPARLLISHGKIETRVQLSKQLSEIRNQQSKSIQNRLQIPHETKELTTKPLITDLCFTV